MKSYICFLRGINVSGQKKIKMAELKETLVKRGFENVKTYIQSGNVVIQSKKSSKELQSIIEKSIKQDFGFDVPVLLTTKITLVNILEGIPFKNADEKNLYFTFLIDEPDKFLVNDFKELKFINEEFFFTKNCVYLNCKKGAGRAKLNNNLIEKKLKVNATTRNLNTLKKMIEMTS